ncbi:peptidoglycan editing factor PgeF [Ornithinibacillus halotolerans]|uniref:Purine nucleoside phosphorylase n=1 Tax=Ornithinibacillus halotolerans TaxID=1274357 RepID=A0A916WAY4_9BACI|nr:peptidoglycan editing factor PgeF [Ornithinibacillus halotolerans]GGA83997.1 laccase domain protein YlmD [Ornithinibacillus halotolerans]
MEDILQLNVNDLLLINKWKELNPNLQVGFTTRNGGNSKGDFESNNFGLHVSDDYKDVIANRRKLAETLTIPLDKWVAAEQIHSNKVYHVHVADAGRGSITIDSSIKGIDGLITKEKGILCTAFFADCVPLFFFDPHTEYIGIAHAGWQGSVKRIAEEMTKQFVKLGSNLEDILVVVGPCITYSNYEIDHFVFEQIPDDFRNQVTEPTNNNHYLLDLKQLNVEILVQSGIIRSNIDVTKYCTFRDNNLFFSHRRDNGKTGRMLGFIGYCC